LTRLNWGMSVEPVRDRCALLAERRSRDGAEWTPRRTEFSGLIEGGERA
jgi:hypothetical protein